MPVLHKYKAKDSYYVLTSINNSIITFHLTADGYQKLTSSGIAAEDRFGRAILFDLYRTGDAFTHGTGAGKFEGTDRRQLVFDFPDDPEPESIFPSCSICNSISDLHLVEVKDKEHFAGIYCSDCRRIRSATINTSIPLPLINRNLISRVFEMNNIPKSDKSLTEYRKQLDTEFAMRWEEIAKTKSVKKSTTQNKLFESEDDQGRLI